MEVWTFINKKSGEIVRFNVKDGDDEFGIQYYFTEFKSFPIWFVDSEEKARFAYKDFVHAQYAQFPESPATDRINILDYEIRKFVHHEDNI